MALAEESSGPAATSAAFAPLRNDAPPTTGLSGDVGAEVSAAEAEAPHALRQRRRRRQATTKNSPNLRPAPSPSTPSLFARHASWVRANAGAVAALESALSSATWLMPDRFSEGEAPALEGAHALLGLLSLYHEALLSVDESSSSSPRGLFGALGWPLWLAAIQQVSMVEGGEGGGCFSEREGARERGREGKHREKTRKLFQPRSRKKNAKIYT